MTPHELKIFATHIGFLYRANRERDFDEFRLSFNRCPSVEVTVKKGEYFFDGVCVGNVQGAAEAYAKIVSSRMDPITDTFKAIAMIGGNLPDDRITHKSGPNDSVHRGLMYVEARRLANAALKTLEIS